MKKKENVLGRQKDSRKIGKADKMAESQRAIEKEEITSTWSRDTINMMARYHCQLMMA